MERKEWGVKTHRWLSTGCVGTSCLPPLEEGSLSHSFLYPLHLAWCLAHSGHPVTIEVMEKWVDKTLESFREDGDWEVRQSISIQHERGWVVLTKEPVPEVQLLDKCNLCPWLLSGWSNWPGWVLGPLGKDCYRTKKPQLMCFAWLCSNDPIQREMGIVLSAATILTWLT